MEDYFWYYQHGLDFYDHPGVSGADGHALVERREPDGWVMTNDSTWTFFRPSVATLPEQGWKVHVSVTQADADAAIEIVAKYCFARSVPFKVLTRRQTHLRQNSKNAPRGRSGKLITIYPVDPVELRAVLDELNTALEGKRGPYVLSDLRWRNGPLYVRYGGFDEMYAVDDRGRRVLAVRRPDGTLVPDSRGPSFRTPPWVELPDYLAEQQLMAKSETTGPMPYTVRKALHFSNGGGIYLAEDPASGKAVVLREARPFAGLDGAGHDAVSRLHREHRTLQDLGDLDFVPTPEKVFTCWEHHFLAQEYVEGLTLMEFLSVHNPATRGGAGADEYRAYVDTALDIVDQIGKAISAIHDRGYVYADLHPRNVMVRPDGRVALVDFEVAYRPGLDPEPTIACPGFVAKHALSGRSRDLYALDCLRVAVFLPLTQMLDLDPEKAVELPEAVTEIFGVPQQVTTDLAERLRPPSATPLGSRRNTEFADAAANPQGAEMRSLTDAMARAIAASATPERQDRLFPGDPRALHDGGYTMAHGAAGVLYALASTGRPVEEHHVDWLLAAARRTPARAGLWDGLHGVALVLHGLGREQEACEILEKAGEKTADVNSVGLHDGLAGIALVLRYMAVVTGDSRWQDALAAIDYRLAVIVSTSGDVTPAADGARAGLMHGLAGAALFFLRRHQDTGDDAYLRLAGRAIEADLEHCRVDAAGEVALVQGVRSMPYLGEGSGGLAEALALYLRRVPDERLATWQTGVVRACRSPFIVEPGLLQGRAGLVMVQAGNMGQPGSAGAGADHVRRLALHAVRRGDATGAGRTVAFPGHRLLRLSMDLASGTAGVLVALDSYARAADPAAAGLSGKAVTWAESTGLPSTA
ncbi:class III lanthionine synthetase LanKC [Umezawaea endophytica]|uniref:Class III lanthionine synthetase LanKC n=1 Tax=Umezawaea endophytica TaxID=1654476 RepID=A0A9X2VPV7_9PSEU|nr:class III lanthionine synthetase LanKC [Umezawaea endophytica]MCS7480409.1 class III lanthionine synthetase LanKC [Umezawaea endophytica]